MSTIRVLDLNIWNYNEPWPARRDLIVDLISDAQPDIVALQEIRYHERTADLQHQADQSYTHWAWEPCRRIDYLFLPSSVKVQEISVVGAVPNRESISPSDHCGLLATLEVKDGA